MSLSILMACFLGGCKSYNNLIQIKHNIANQKFIIHHIVCDLVDLFAIINTMKFKPFDFYKTGLQKMHSFFPVWLSPQLFWGNSGGQIFFFFITLFSTFKSKIEWQTASKFCQKSPLYQDSNRHN